MCGMLQIQEKTVGGRVIIYSNHCLFSYWAFYPQKISEFLLYLNPFSDQILGNCYIFILNFKKDNLQPLVSPLLFQNNKISISDQ